MSKIPTLSEVINNAIPNADNYYLYFLIENDSIVYVGKTNSVEGRLYDHRRSKKFDSYSVFKCENEEDAINKEALSIMEYQPKYNVALNDGFKSINVIKKTLKQLGADDYQHDKRNIKHVISGLGVKTYFFKANTFILDSDANKVINFILGGRNE